MTTSSTNGFTYPTTDEMDNNTAQRLVKECATLIIEDIPMGTEFGIDLNVNNIGDHFMGVKMIAPGLHFIYYSSVSKDGTVGPRSGFFRFFKPQELVVRKWHQFDEDIDEEYTDSVQYQRYKDNVSNGSMDVYLAVYQFSTYADWVGLTDYITDSLFNRINPKSGKILSVTHLITKSGKNLDKNIIEKDSEGLLVMERDPNAVINFSELPKHFLYPQNSSATQVSQHSMDSSYTMETIASRCEQIESLLGELQFSFITFLVGHIFDSFDYWKQLLKILCFSEKSIIKYTDFYLNFIRVLHFQLKQTPHELFADIVENNNFLVVFLRQFFFNIDSNDVNEVLRNRGQRFRKFLTKTFKWDFVSQQEDEEPTIVDIN
ncbi:protein AAR2 homolog [Oppia nitens]|uniref:protein AAR2 homolog n=1 Tax=Oppia nitens TaxID=1686743 RepID=UPI0023DCB215|nr:protein AAR2 homolog [Oppia nitens]